MPAMSIPCPARAARTLRAVGLALAVTSLTAPAPAQSDAWDVEAAHGPSFLFEEVFEEGTWISVDVAPDGEHLVFDLLGHLYELPITGGEARALTEGRSWNMFPRYSPDGESLAFTSDRGGSNDLWVLERRGGRLATSDERLRNVSDRTRPVFQGTWSADGEALYGTLLDMQVSFEVHRFELRGGSQRVRDADGRTPVNHWQENPRDGLAYFVHNAGSLPRSGPRLRTWDLVTGEQRTLVDRPGGAAAVRLSPDGARLAYVHRDDLVTELVVRDLDTGVERSVVRGLDRGRFESRGFYGCHPNIAWHPDGSAIYLSAGGRIQRVEVSTGVMTEVPFRARVRRQVDETIRHTVELPRGTSTTRSHRDARRTDVGVLYETLGDLWLRDEHGVTHRLTDSPEHEGAPTLLPDGRLAFTSWTDDGLGRLRVSELVRGDARKADAGWSLMPSEAAEGLPHDRSQVGSLDATHELVYLRGADDLRTGTRLEDQTRFELVHVPPAALIGMGAPRVVTEIEWSRNRYFKRRPWARHDGDEHVLFTEVEGGVLVLKRVHESGRDERLLARFPHATRAVLSPDGRWVAFREDHRTWVAPFAYVGRALSLGARSGGGTCTRVDEDDGDFFQWSADGQTLTWVRGRWFCEKRLEDILAGHEGEYALADLSRPFEVEAPDELLALTGVRVLSMDADDTVLEDATILVRGDTIEEVGVGLAVPDDATVLPLAGRTVMPGMLDAHGHYGSRDTLFGLVEQRHHGLLANLAHGVTTMVDVYGTTHRDHWISDMLRAGRMDGPRILSVGDPIFVTTYRDRMYRPIRGLGDAMDHARYEQDHGAVVLKDYSNHRRAARQQLAAACRDLGLNVVSESFGNPQMVLTELIDGYTGIEHTLGLAELYADVRALFAATEVGITPTLLVLYNGRPGQTWFHARERLWEDDKLLQFFRKDELLSTRRPTWAFEDEFHHPAMAATMKQLHDEGVLVQMGAHGELMGRGAHWELELLVHGGFTPYEALRVATINGYRHHGLDGQLGSIEAGKLADMVVLDADPREDIRNAQAIDLVLKNGVVHDGFDGSRVLPERRPYRKLYFQDPVGPTR